jgi:TonB-linked SusC/RagA family outer membrane protein
MKHRTIAKSPTFLIKSPKIKGMKKTLLSVKLALTQHRSLFKTFLFMKMTIALILLTTLQAIAGDANAQFVSLQMKQADMPKVFKAIEKQSPYRFLYNYDLPALQKKVDVNVSGENVVNLLDNILSGSGLNYKILENNLVVVLPTESMAVEGRPVSGKVLTETGEPLVGAVVMVKGTNVGTTTDSKGNFTIKVADNSAVLVVSYVNYEKRDIVVGTADNLKVSLKAQSNELNQVVVVGYGTQKKKDLTGSVSSISSKELENGPNDQFGYAIEGKAAGVQVIRASGQPQAGFSIRVRGTSSITSGSDPLYIVDGVQTYNTSEINPADIENITVLKDASSAAIYGSSGANGVVIITTKRGKNQKLKLNYTTSMTMSSAWKKMDVLNADQFKALATDMGATTDWSKLTANTNWQNEIFRNAISQNHQLSATGGNEKTAYYLSGSFNDQNGIVLNNNLQRTTLKANIDHQLMKMLKLGTSISYDSWKDVDVPENDRNGVITRLYTSIPNIGIRDASNPAMYARSPFINDLENPVSTVNQPQHLNTNNRIHGNVYAEAEILKGLKLKSLFGAENSNGKFTSFQDAVQTRYGKSMGGLSSENTYKYDYWISENTANYNTNIKEHAINVLAGYIISREKTDNLYKSAHDFTNAPAGSTNVEDGATKSIPTPYFVQKSHQSFIGRLNYSYNDKYYVTSNFRADGSGQFSEQNKWGFFPSFSGGWRLSKENFLKDAANLSELKLRAGWGLVGNDRAQPYAWYGLVDTMSKYLIGGKTVTAYTPSTLENKDLRWEKTAQLDIGIDIGLFNNRVSFTADYYEKKTNDMLLSVPTPTSTGFGSALQNAGSMENKGFEFQLSTKNIATSDLVWNTDFNISFNKNKVLNIVGNTIHTGAINPAGDDFNTAIVQEGKPLGSFFGKVSLGVDPKTGMMKYLTDVNGYEDSVGIIGNANPKYVFGFNNTVRYKNWSLDVFFQGVQGNQIFNATRVLTESMSLAMNQSATVVNRWQHVGDITNMPKVTPNDWSNATPSSRFIEDGSYVRLKALTVSYNLKSTTLSKYKISRCLIYLTGQNLLTFTNYSGFDPEVSAFGVKGASATNQNTAPGVDYGTYPQSRSYILGLNISF